MRRQLPWALVLEDDVALPVDFVRRACAALRRVPPSATAPLLYLGHGAACRLEEELAPSEAEALEAAAKQAATAEEAAADAAAEAEGAERVPAPRILRAEYAFCTHAMAVSLAAARLLLQGAAPVDKPADHHYVLVSSSGAVQAYVCEPQLVPLSAHSEESIIKSSSYSSHYAAVGANGA